MGSLLFRLRGAGLGDGFGFGSALLELVHATSGIHKFLLAGVKGMRGAADTHLVQRIFLALKGGRFLRGRAGAGEKFLAIARVAEDHRTVFIRMNVLLHKSGRESNSHRELGKREFWSFFRWFCGGFPFPLALRHNIAGPFAAKNLADEVPIAAHARVNSLGNPDNPRHPKQQRHRHEQRHSQSDEPQRPRAA